MFKKTEERLSFLIWDMKDKEKAYLKLLEMKTTLSKMKKKKKTLDDSNSRLHTMEEILRKNSNKKWIMKHKT